MLLLTVGLTAVAWGAVQLSRHAINSDDPHHVVDAVQDFLVNLDNPPVCYYEGISERTERPASTRDWAYTLVLGDCHPQENSLTKVIIDALLPQRAASLAVQVPENPLQYPQSSPAVTSTAQFTQEKP